MSFPVMAPERDEQLGCEELISRIRTATDRILDLTRAEMNAARQGNVSTAKMLGDRLACERQARETLLRLLKQLAAGGDEITARARD